MTEWVQLPHMEKRCVTDLPLCEVADIILFSTGRSDSQRASNMRSADRPTFNRRYLIPPWQGLDALVLTSPWGQTERSLGPLLSGIWITMKSPLSCFSCNLCHWPPSRFVHHDERSVLASLPQVVSTPKGCFQLFSSVCDLL